MQHDRRLPRYLALAYALLTAYACLHPFSGWRDTGISPFAFLVAPLPRYNTFADLWLNALGFVPLGFMLAASFWHGSDKRIVLMSTILLCALLSGSLEFVQNYLPTRVASNVDLATNTFGGLLGGLAGLYWGNLFDYSGALASWRRRRILPGHIGEVGMVLIALWWLTQLEPTSTLFGTGDMRPLFDLPAAIMFSARRFVVIETLIVSLNVIALGLLLRRCMQEPSGVVVMLVLLGGLAVRSLADYIFIVPPAPWQWATPGALRGLLVGVTALIVAWRLPGWLQHSLACLAILLCTVLVNIAPENPFELASMRLIHESHFLNFHGLTRLADFLWPFLALIYLSANAALVSRR
ncbi:VanZ family protein [Uliginosibacterium sp. H3]|uniref:VanZ family protein n=1 Tax=Uliginosibacterium silvisoli TaxID=3114758 RepID=A0ABU6K283_9RHOO|nr:VanZ family protein [Uliginosibacterium sp. H3]